MAKAAACPYAIVVECPTIQCEATGLESGAVYDITAVAVVAGEEMSVANVVELTMPQLGAPMLTVEGTGSRSGRAVANPANMTYDWVRAHALLAKGAGALHSFCVGRRRLAVRAYRGLRTPQGQPEFTHAGPCGHPCCCSTDSVTRR